MSNLMEHAKRELALVGNGPEFDAEVLKMVQTFADMGHSGSSAFYTIGLLEKILSFQNLSLLTNDRDEWYEVEMIPGKRCWQNSRRSDAFTYDADKRFYYTLADHESMTYDQFMQLYWTQTDDRAKNPRQFKDTEIALFETKDISK